MKTSVLKITAVSLLATLLVAAPAALRAAEPTNAPASRPAAPVKHKKSEPATLPFHGKLRALDTNAMTLTVGERTFEITSETRLSKDGQPATLADGVVGEMVGGAFKKTADGKLSATSIHFGAKSDGAKKKKKQKAAAESMETSTNSAAQ